MSLEFKNVKDAMTRNDVLKLITNAIFEANKTHGQKNLAAGEEPIYVAPEMGSIYAHAALDALVKAGVVKIDA